MKIALGSDHVGITLKVEIAALLDKRGVEYHDFGTYDQERTDYPIYGARAARAVASGDFDRGIVMCGTGVGISIAANKIDGIRCVVCSEPYSAALSRAHNNTNMLAMGSRVVGVDLAKMIVEAWLTASYEGGRHALRVDELAAIERGQIL